MNVCDHIGILRLILYAKKILGVIGIVVPIILIIKLALDFAKGVIGDDKDRKEVVGIVTKRLVFAILIFFVPILINALLSMTGVVKDNEINCYSTVSSEKLKELIISQVDEQISKIDESNINYDDLMLLNDKISQIDDENTRSQYESKWNNLKSKYDTQEAQREKERAEKEKQEQEEAKKREEERKKNNDNGNGSGNGSNDETSGGNGKSYTNTIFVGDSRTEDMCNFVSIKSTESCIAKVSMGYYWYVNTALPQVEQKLKSSQQYNIVVNMGTNDLGTSNIASSYASKHNDLASRYPNANIIIVSITPVNDSLARRYGYTETNSQVINFNTQMKSSLSSNVKYCDVYSKVINSFGTSDGIHYNTSTYKQIYNAIEACI